MCEPVVTEEVHVVTEEVRMYRHRRGANMLSPKRCNIPNANGSSPKECEEVITEKVQIGRHRKGEKCRHQRGVNESSP
ncbi:hypothetical protein F2Q69_00038996 [Brassica cretica]|uniref:Uncharacterized protein n=1 Tax=Brassica cretica TaxID=69181 RepID=A0A8S9SQ24_BRACR|nr:hypothetical protein F2Q69_00038996 [Brassica cretica]